MNDQSKITTDAIFNAASVVDELGFIKAQIAELEAKEKALTEALKATGAETFAGAFFDCSVSRSERETVKTKELKEALGEDIMKDFIKRTPVVTLRLVAKK